MRSRIKKMLALHLCVVAIGFDFFRGPVMDDGFFVMACTFPIPAWQVSSGEIFFVRPRSRYARELQLPCGQCMACRLAKSREWAVRCTHEAQLYEKNCFVTMTYAPHVLPADGSISKRHVQLFLKRLRKKGFVFRYLCCGEYGEKFARPHYHVIFFGEDWSIDRRLFSNKKFPLYISDILSECWGYGHVVIGEFSWESAAYVARYATKKITGSNASDVYDGRTPEFLLVSTKPGIGFDFFQKYYLDIYPSDSVVLRGGIQLRPPRYYDVLLERGYPDIYATVKDNRLAHHQVIPLAHAFDERERLERLDGYYRSAFLSRLRSYESDLSL